MGPSIAGGIRGSGASAHKAFSDPIRDLRKGEQVWSWFPALAMTFKAPVHREPEAAQTLLVSMACRDLVEKSESTGFLNKQALGLSLVSEESFTLANAAPRSQFCAFSEMGPSWFPR